MRTERRPIQNKLGLLNLSSGETSTIDGVQSFSFSGDGAFLAIALSPTTPAKAEPGAAAPATPTGTTGSGGAGAAAADDEPTGATVIVRDLNGQRTPASATSENTPGRTTSRTSPRAHDQRRRKTGNGVHLFDPKTTIFRVLDSSAAEYVGLSWR